MTDSQELWTESRGRGQKAKSFTGEQAEKENPGEAESATGDPNDE